MAFNQRQMFQHHLIALRFRGFALRGGRQVQLNPQFLLQTDFGGEFNIQLGFVVHAERVAGAEFQLGF